MSIIERIPTNSGGVRVRYPVKRFFAPFVAGQYDFNQPANVNVPLMELQSNSIYLIERYSFFAQAAESDWLESMGAEANFPNFVVNYLKDSAESLFPNPVQCVNYQDNVEQLVFFRTTTVKETLLISFTGIVNQVAGMVGFDPLLAEVNLVIYQITDEKWNQNFITQNFQLNSVR